MNFSPRTIKALIGTAAASVMSGLVIWQSISACLGPKMSATVESTVRQSIGGIAEKSLSNLAGDGWNTDPHSVSWQLDSNVRQVAAADGMTELRRLPAPQIITPPLRGLSLDPASPPSSPPSPPTTPSHSTVLGSQGAAPQGDPDHRVTGEAPRGASQEVWLRWHQEINAAEANAPQSANSTPKVDRELLRSRRVPTEVATQATAQLQEAVRLAERKAYYSSRQEFINVLRLITQSLDAELPTQYHSRALYNGLQALEEASDFALGDTRVETDLHVAGYVNGHQTPVLKGKKLDGVTPIVAMQKYYEYAHRQLAIAGNQDAIASQALFGLGRLENRLQQENVRAEHRGPVEIAYYHAATTICPHNYYAANELGVQLARSGQLAEACRVLERTAAVAPSPALLNNLAKLQSRLGNLQAMEQARQSAQQLARSNPSFQSQDSRISVVTNDQFTQISGPDVMATMAEPIRTVNHRVPVANPPTPGPEDRSPSRISRIFSAVKF